MNGISKLDLKRQNRMQILKILQTMGPTSRIDIAKIIGITKAAVTIITNEMINNGIIYEKGEQLPKGNKAPRGRKKILLDINSTYKMSMGLVIDNGFIYFGLSTLRGDTVEKHIKSISENDTAEDILSEIEKIYKDVVYKNDIRAYSLVGVGICISKEYYGMFNIITDEKGNADYTRVHEAVAEFIGFPVVFGTVTEGIAVAENDCEGNGNKNGTVLLRCSEKLECVASVKGDLYRGAHGNGINLLSNRYFKHEKIKDGYYSALKEIYSPEKTPVLWSESAGNLQVAFDNLENCEYIVQDRAVFLLFDEIAEGYLELFKDLILFWDPDKIILFSEKDSCLFDYILGKVKMNFNSDKEEIIVKSRYSTLNIYLTASAMAIREFFINKGGF